MMLILSKTNQTMARVEELPGGCVAHYYRRKNNKTDTGYTDMTEWRFLHSAIIPAPFHQALDIAHTMVNVLK